MKRCLLGPNVKISLSSVFLLLGVLFLWPVTFISRRLKDFPLLPNVRSPGRAARCIHFCACYRRVKDRDYGITPALRAISLSAINFQ